MRLRRNAMKRTSPNIKMMDGYKQRSKIYGGCQRSRIQWQESKT